jgi:hypothetical protein
MGIRSSQWYVLVQDSSGGASITIANGEIVQEKPSLNLGELFKNPSPIAVERMTIDSSAAFDIAQQFAEANGKNLGTVSYVLQQSGADSAPVWQVWCYDRGGRYFDTFQIAATNGAVISTDGLPRAPESSIQLNLAGSDGVRENFQAQDFGCAGSVGTSSGKVSRKKDFRDFVAHLRAPQRSQEEDLVNRMRFEGYPPHRDPGRP